MQANVEQTYTEQTNTEPTNPEQTADDGFFLSAGQWFFRARNGREFGPFNTMRITQIGERNHHETEISEPLLSSMLQQLSLGH